MTIIPVYFDLSKIERMLSEAHSRESPPGLESVFQLAPKKLQRPFFKRGPFPHEWIRYSVQARTRETATGVETKGLRSLGSANLEQGDVMRYAPHPEGGPMYALLTLDVHLGVELPSEGYIRRFQSEFAVWDTAEDGRRVVRREFIYPAKLSGPMPADLGRSFPTEKFLTDDTVNAGYTAVPFDKQARELIRP
jgi:hypothetical protein